MSDPDLLRESNTSPNLIPNPHLNSHPLPHAQHDPMLDGSSPYLWGGGMEDSQHLLIQAIRSLEVAYSAHQNIFRKSKQPTTTRESLQADITTVALNFKQTLHRLSLLHILLFNAQCRDSDEMQLWETIGIEVLPDEAVLQSQPCQTLMPYAPAVGLKSDLKQLREILEVKFSAVAAGIPKDLVEKLCALEKQFDLERDPRTNSIWNVDHQLLRVEAFQDGEKGKAYRLKCECDQTVDPVVHDDVHCPRNIVHDAESSEESEEESAEETAPTPVKNPTEKAKSKAIFTKMMDYVGRDNVKDHFRMIRDMVSSKYQEKDPWAGQYHGAVFLGPSDTGKIKFARLYANYLISCGISHDYLVEKQGTDLLTHDEPKYTLGLMKSDGGVLCINDAHVLISYRQREKSALALILDRVAKRKGKITLILSGHNAKLQTFLEERASPELIPYVLPIPVITAVDVQNLLITEMKNWFGDKATVEDGWDGLYMRIAAKRVVEKEKIKEKSDYGHAVRYLVSEIWNRQSARLTELRKEEADEASSKTSETKSSPEESKESPIVEKVSEKVTDAEESSEDKPKEQSTNEDPEIKSTDLLETEKDSPKPEVTEEQSLEKDSKDNVSEAESIEAKTNNMTTKDKSAPIIITSREVLPTPEAEKENPVVDIIPDENIEKPNADKSQDNQTGLKPIDEVSDVPIDSLKGEGPEKLEVAEKAEIEVQKQEAQTEEQPTDDEPEAQADPSIKPTIETAESGKVKPTDDLPTGKSESGTSTPSVQEVQEKKTTTDAKSGISTPDVSVEEKKVTSDAVETSSKDSDNKDDERKPPIFTEPRDPRSLIFTKDDILGPCPGLKMTESESWKKLQSLTGLGSVKSALTNISELAKTNYQRELEEKPPLDFTFNRLFLGPPGTGKTVVAKLYGKILAEMGVLSKGDVVTKNASALLGKYIGHSEANTEAALEESKGGVLVIDEAYMLYTSNSSGRTTTDVFRQAIIDTLVGGIQNVPGEDRCVILLGYEDKMREMIAKANPGLARRFPMEDAFMFENFTLKQLEDILRMKLEEYKLEATEEAIAIAMGILDKARSRLNFGNGGDVENLITRAKSNCLGRIIAIPEAERPKTWKFEPQDFDPEFNRHLSASENLKKLFADVVDCEPIIEKFTQYQTVCRVMKARNLDPTPYIPTNFIFKGPPGTGKTTTARKVAQIYYDMGFLSEPSVIECSVSDLIGSYVGQTAPKTIDALERGLGKVLFIDEAYRLGSSSSSYATEAVSELVDQLTKPKFLGKIVVVLAGYEDEMNGLLAVNPGLASRFPEEIKFELLSPSGCLEVLSTKLKETGITLPIVQDKSTVEYRELERSMRCLSNTKGWGNARDVDTLSKAISRKVFAAPLVADGDLVCTKEVVMTTLEEFLKERKARNGEADFRVLGLYN